MIAKRGVSKAPKALLKLMRRDGASLTRSGAGREVPRGARTPAAQRPAVPAERLPEGPGVTCSLDIKYY